MKRISEATNEMVISEEEMKSEATNEVVKENEINP